MGDPGGDIKKHRRVYLIKFSSSRDAGETERTMVGGKIVGERSVVDFYPAEDS